MKEEEIKKLAENLIGSCDSSPEELENMSMEELEVFDSITLKCCGCGYWVEPGDMSENEEEPLCKECDE